MPSNDELAPMRGRGSWAYEVGDSSDSSFATDNLDETEQVTAALSATGSRMIVTRVRARRASEAQGGSSGGEPAAESTGDAEVEDCGTG